MEAVALPEAAAAELADPLLVPAGVPEEKLRDRASPKRVPLQPPSSGSSSASSAPALTPAGLRRSGAWRCEAMKGSDLLNCLRA